MTSDSLNGEAKRFKCPDCGAMKEQTAAKKCRPVRDCTDEYSCPMDNAKTDEEGWFISW